MAQCRQIDMNANPGTLVIERRRHWAYSGRAFAIYADGQKTNSTVRIGRESEVRLDPGPHTMQVRVSLARSNTQNVVVRAGQSIRLQCGIDDVGWKRVLMFMPWRHETLYLIQVLD